MRRQRHSTSDGKSNSKKRNAGVLRCAQNDGYMGCSGTLQALDVDGGAVGEDFGDSVHDFVGVVAEGDDGVGA